MHGVGRVFGAPPYKVWRFGKLVAVIGVDGSGKTTFADKLVQEPFFKLTGIKKIYFGNNQFWIPGLSRLARIENKRFSIMLILYIMTRIDRQLRIFKALYYMCFGNLVIAERYFYDDEVQYAAKLNRDSFLVRLGKSLLRPRCIKKPDLTLFFDVTADTAYKRKQDYPFDTMVSLVNHYRVYLKDIDNVVVLDADKPVDDVFHLSVKMINEMLFQEMLSK